MMNSPKGLLNRNETCDKLKPVKTMSIPGGWAKLLRRLMGLQAGHYVFAIEIAEGGLVGWREFVGGKAES